MAKAIPEGLHSVTAQLSIDGAKKALDWYQKALGAEVKNIAPDPSGQKIWHSEMRIGDAVVFVNDTFPEMGGSKNTEPATLWLYGEKVDERWQRAVDAGAKITMPITDMFWGDRTGQLTDPFGIRWHLSQHLKDMTPAEMKKAQDDFVAQMKK